VNPVEILGQRSGQECCGSFVNRSSRWINCRWYRPVRKTGMVETSCSEYSYIFFDCLFAIMGWNPAAIGQPGRGWVFDQPGHPGSRARLSVAKIVIFRQVC
jgi:hypothetical protein